MKKHVLALDQRGDISKYISHHDNIWPEIVASFNESGVRNIEIFHVANRLVMILETDNDFSFDKKAKLDERNPKVVEWEALMSQFQERIPNAPGEGKWAIMNKIFNLEEHR